MAITTETKLMTVGLETNILYQGDCKIILKNLPADSVDLIYIDPPFFSNKTYEVIWGNGAELKAFEDRWKGDIMNYVSWMVDRIEQMHRILKPTGSFYLHCDWRAVANLKVECDKIFGENNFQNWIIWSFKGGGSSKDKFARRHNDILFYTKSKKYTFNPDNIRVPYTTFLKRSGKWGWGHHKGVEKSYAPNPKGKIPEDVWEIAPINSMSKERLGYPTQKPEELLSRIILASTNEGDIVLDAMMGGGTTLAVAQKLNRKWIGIDVSPLACEMTAKRLRKLGVADIQIVSGEITEAKLR